MYRKKPEGIATRSSIEFLKKEAKKANVPYQRMLRALVDKYVEQHT